MLETANQTRAGRTAIAFVERLRPLSECVCVCVCVLAKYLKLPNIKH